MIRVRQPHHPRGRLPGSERVRLPSRRDLVAGFGRRSRRRVTRSKRTLVVRNRKKRQDGNRNGFCELLFARDHAANSRRNRGRRCLRRQRCGRQGFQALLPIPCLALNQRQQSLQFLRDLQISPATFSGWRVPAELNSSPAKECPASTGRLSLSASITAKMSSPRRSAE
jgi:hypothetical protein